MMGVTDFEEIDSIIIRVYYISESGFNEFELGVGDVSLEDGVLDPSEVSFKEFVHFGYSFFFHVIDDQEEQGEHSCQRSIGL